MSCAEMLQTALSPSGLPVFPNVYTGDEDEYLVTNYTTIPEVHAEGVADAARYLIQVHYYLPPKQNPNAVLEALSLALAAADCTCPEIVPAEEKNKQHYVLECEYCDGGYAYG